MIVKCPWRGNLLHVKAVCHLSHTGNSSVFNLDGDRNSGREARQLRKEPDLQTKAPKMLQLLHKINSDWVLQPFFLFFFLSSYFFLFCFVCFHQSCFLTKILVRTTKLHSCHVAEETHKLSSSVAGIFPFHLMKPSLPFLLLTLSFDLSTLPFPLVMPLLKHPKWTVSS